MNRVNPEMPRTLKRSYNRPVRKNGGEINGAVHVLGPSGLLRGDRQRGAELGKHISVLDSGRYFSTSI